MRSIHINKLLTGEISLVLFNEEELVKFYIEWVGGIIDKSYTSDPRSMPLPCALVFPIEMYYREGRLSCLIGSEVRAKGSAAERFGSTVRPFVPHSYTKLLNTKKQHMKIGDISSFLDTKLLVRVCSKEELVTFLSILNEINTPATQKATASWSENDWPRKYIDDPPSIILGISEDGRMRFSRSQDEVYAFIGDNKRPVKLLSDLLLPEDTQAPYGWEFSEGEEGMCV